MKKLVLVGMGLFLSFSVSAADYKSALTGKVLRTEGATCAGISLTKNSGLMGEQPLSKCSIDLPARVKWISEDTFMLVQSEKPNDISPPRVFISKVKSIKGNKVVLTEIWAGWGNQPNEDTIYTIVN